MIRGHSLLVLGLLFLAGCGGDPKKPPVTPPPVEQLDTTPPRAVTDLAVSATTNSSATLIWTAPGDDGDDGTATRYDIRYSYRPITPARWGELPSAPGRPQPLPAGTRTDFTVTALPSGVTYYFALRAADEESNWASLSNIATAAVGPDVISPEQVRELTVVAVTDTSATLRWAAPGDDYNLGTAMRYDIRYSRTLEGMNSQWDQATQIENEPTPAPAGSSETVTIAGLLPGTLYFVGIKAADERDNWSVRSCVELRTTTPADAHWSDLFDSNGMDSRVQCLASYNGSLVAGGNFRTAGSVPVPYLARWDGTTWSAMGRFRGVPEALAVHGDALFAGGSFDWSQNDDGSLGGCYLSSWKNGAWSSVGEGVSNGSSYTTCTALLSFGDRLIVGGLFQKAGRLVNARNIAAWDGQLWHGLKSGLNDQVFCLTSFNGVLVAGGVFDQIVPSLVRKVAWYDGTSCPNWCGLGYGISQGGSDVVVYALTVFNRELIAAGNFLYAGGNSAHGVARWSRGAWQSLGEPNGGWDDEYPRAWALAVYNGRLIVGGDYSARHRSCIATWDGSSWGQLGTGIGGERDAVYALAVHDEKLFVGGQFTRAGNKVSRSIACWTD